MRAEDFHAQFAVVAACRGEIRSGYAQRMGLLARANLENRFLMVEQGGPSKCLAGTERKDGHGKDGGVQLDVHAAGSDEIEKLRLPAVHENHFVFGEGDGGGQRSKLGHVPLRESLYESVISEGFL